MCSEKNTKDVSTPSLDKEIMELFEQKLLSVYLFNRDCGTMFFLSLSMVYVLCTTIQSCTMCHCCQRHKAHGGIEIELEPPEPGAKISIFFL
jgi:hypothetical protein